MSNILLFLILLMGSAFFSGMEAAIFSVSRFRLSTLLFENVKGAQILTKLRNYPHKTLVTLLFSSNLVNIGLTSVATIFLARVVKAHRFNTTWAFIGETIIMTSILLIFGEITPKVIAYSRREFFALNFGKVVELIGRIFEPIANFSETAIRNIAQIGKIVAISEEDVKYILKEAETSGILDERERELAIQILNFGKTKVGEIMTSKERAVGINLNCPVIEAKEVIKFNRHSRILVYNDKGEIEGVLYAKDIFLKSTKEQTKTVEEIMREPYFVEDTKFIDDLLLEFRRKGVHFGIVVNKKGEFVGIVTLNDILSFLIGNT